MSKLYNKSNQSAFIAYTLLCYLKAVMSIAFVKRLKFENVRIDFKDIINLLT